MQHVQRINSLQPSSKNEKGQGTVEFSLIALTLVLIIFAIVDLGRAMSIYSFLAGAAQAAARAGSVTTDVSAIEAAAQARMTSFPSESVVITVDQSGNYTEVTLEYLFQPITPLVALALGEDSLALSNTARVRRLGSGGGGGGGAPAATNTPPPGATNTPPPAATNTPPPAATNTPQPTPTACWPPGKCKK